MTRGQAEPEEVTESEIPMDMDTTISSTAGTEVGTRQAVPREVVLLLLLMLTVTTLSLVTSFYLYRWRKKLIDGQGMLVPEELIDSLTRMREANSKLAIATNQSASASQLETKDSITEMRTVLQTFRSEVDTEITQLRKTFLTLRDGVNQRDKEIKRLQDGYDISLLRTYLRQILSLKPALLNARKDFPSSSEALDRIEQTLTAILENYDVEHFEPSIGTPLREYGDEIAGDHELVPILSEEQKPGTIAVVLETGFRALVGEDKWVVIKPARVSVYGARNDRHQNPKGGE